jgi:hypothetical protein
MNVYYCLQTNITNRLWDEAKKKKREKSSSRIYDWRQSNSSFFTLLRYGSLILIFTFSGFSWRQLTFLHFFSIYLLFSLLYQKWVNDERKKIQNRIIILRVFLLLSCSKKSPKKIQTRLPYLSKEEILTAILASSVASIIVFVLSYE